MHERAKEREHLLQQEKQQLEARVRYLEQQLYGKKSESARSKDSLAAAAAPTTRTPGVAAARPRGQQRDQPGPRRRDYSHLPGEEEFCDLAAADKKCPCCGLPFESFPGTQDSTVLEIDVRAHRRVIRRRRYKPTCTCPDNPGIITAPGPAKLIPKSIFGVSIWVQLLLDVWASPMPRPTLIGLHLMWSGDG